ncbi:MAG: bifunctional glycosyltransferase family 2/GtrA family protein [Pseudodesulfovibrio sp.]
MAVLSVGVDTKPVAVIPAYLPDSQLISTVRDLLSSHEFQGVICVNDGSPQEYDTIFNELQEMGCILLLHHCNIGKGAALKTGLNYLACNFSNSVGAVTLDADGQHLVKDCIAVSQELMKDRHSLVLGCRSFTGEIPFRSKMGNILSRKVLSLLGGVSISDTQTGLRGIPYDFIDPLLKLKTIGYDFELEMIMLSRSQAVPIVEVPIDTVYIDGNAQSHFNPILDSLRIYFVFLRHSAVSISATLLDYCIFSLLFFTWGNLVGSLTIARVTGGVYQFLLSRYFVFKSHGELKSEVVKYGGLIVALSVLSVGLTQYFSVEFGVNPLAAKIVIESFLYLFSFAVMNTYVFIGSRTAKRR